MTLKLLKQLVVGSPAHIHPSRVDGKSQSPIIVTVAQHEYSIKIA